LFTPSLGFARREGKYSDLSARGRCHSPFNGGTLSLSRRQAAASCVNVYILANVNGMVVELRPGVEEFSWKK